MEATQQTTGVQSYKRGNLNIVVVYIGESQHGVAHIGQPFIHPGGLAVRTGELHAGSELNADEEVFHSL